MQKLLIIFLSISVAFCAVTKKDRVIKEKPLSDEIPGSLEYDHEAFLGKEKAQEFDQLSPEESLRRLGIIADKLDKNGDGKVDKEELMQWIKFTQNRYVEEDANNQFGTADTNNNGHLEWEEYYKSTYGHLSDEDIKEDEQEQHGYSYKKMIDRDRKRWEKADVNRDEVCSKNEFQSFLHPEEFNHMKDVVLDETLEDIDKDGDGLISLDEYINDMHTQEEGGVEPDWVQVEREQFAEHRDKDKNGKLDRSEVKDWISPEDYDHVDAESLHLIHEADTDQDGVLTKLEILDHHEIFVGSQITNYGEDLKRHDEF